MVYYQGSDSHLKYGAAPTTEELKSHSSGLVNERIHSLQFNASLEMAELVSTFKFNCVKKANSIFREIWACIRPLVTSNPGLRLKLGLNTSSAGIYTVDVALRKILDCINYIDENGEYTRKHIDYFIKLLQEVEFAFAEILQYYRFWFRTDHVQKPDMGVATQRIKEFADKKTIDEIKELYPNSSIINEPNVKNNTPLAEDFNDYEEMDLEEVSDEELSEDDNTK